YTKKGNLTFGETFGSLNGYKGGNAGTILLIGKQRFSRGLWVNPAHETVYDLKDSGVIAFSAFVGVPNDARSQTGSPQRRVFFEIYVDGKLGMHSGTMTLKSDARMM